MSAPYRRRVAVVAVVVVATLLAVAWLATPTPSQAVQRVATDRGLMITMPDGLPLGAELITATGSARHPLIVMPTSWIARETEYHNVAMLFAENGYDVLAYTQRGFTDSQGSAEHPGLVDFAGPATVADVSSVIDWAVTHVHVDPARIGVLGQSYGAGVGLLAAEQDARIRAVAAFSTWTDWGYSFLPSSSLAREALQTLFTSASGAASLDPELTRLAAEYQSDPLAAAALIRSMSAVRSPVTDVAALNANHTAVLIANGLQDSIFPPAQLASFYDRLTGPKRLDLGTGDHGQPEQAALVYGTRTGPLADAFDWFAHYLQGADNGVTAARPVQVTDSSTGARLGYAYWPSTTRNAVDLMAAPTTDGATSLGLVAGGTWSSPLPITGYDTVATTPHEDFAVQQAYPFLRVNADTFSATHSLVWTGLPLSRTTRLVGNVDAALRISATAATTSLYAYLYDVTPDGTATLMSYAPYSTASLRAHAVKDISVRLQPVAWTVPAGHHLTLVIDTVEHRWGSIAPLGSTLTVASDPSYPALLSVPVR